MSTQDIDKETLKADNVNLLRGDAFAVARDMALRGQRFDVIFLDPPYQQDFVAKALPLCRDLLKEGGMVYVEAEFALPQGDDLPEWLTPWEQVRADKAGMVYYHLLKLHENKA